MTSPMPIQWCVAAGLISAAFIIGPGCAGGGDPAPTHSEPAAPVATPVAPVVAPVVAPAAAVPVTPEQLEAFTSMLNGSWKAEGAPGSENESGFWMHIAPVTIDGLANTLYVEQCRGDEPASPYRQAIFQAYLNRGTLRLRTLDLRASAADGGPWALAWLAPDLFPPILPSNLIATMDLEFMAAGDGFDGRTPYPYPNADRGAVEMTSEMKVSKDRLVTTDKGFGPDGSVVWGASGGDSLTWQRADPGFKVKRDDDGLVTITIIEPEGAVTPVEGDTMFIDYSLWLSDGTIVDSSAKTARLMPVQFPIAEGRLVPGFVRGLDSATEGTVRRIIVPAALGFGETQRGPIPANSTLYFRVEVSSVQKPLPPQLEEDAQPEGGAPPQGGGEGDAGGGH